jgi:hypothetical protein
LRDLAQLGIQQRKQLVNRLPLPLASAFKQLCDVAHCCPLIHSRLVRCARPQFHFRSTPEPGGAQVLPTKSLKVKRLNQRVNSLQKNIYTRLAGFCHPTRFVE